MRTIHESQTANSISRWRTARSVVLGSIILAGSMATSAALMYRMAGPTCSQQKREIERGYTYSGIGAVIQQHGDRVMVRQVITDGPADGLLREGAFLVAVDGVTPRSVEDFANALRGPAGSTVAVEVKYGCNSHETVIIERSMIRVQR